MRMKNRVYESMTRVKSQGWTVRVWRDEPNLEAAIAPDNLDIERVVKGVSYRGFSVSNLIRELEALPCIAAIEVLDADGNGTLLYPDWR